MYALGVLLHVIKFKCYPFGTDSVTKKPCEAIVSDYLVNPIYEHSMNDLWNNQPGHSFENLLWNMLQPEPHERFNIFQVYDHPWFQGQKATEAELT